jgi:hypothetical protein
MCPAAVVLDRPTNIQDRQRLESRDALLEHWNINHARDRAVAQAARKPGQEQRDCKQRERDQRVTQESIRSCQRLPTSVSDQQEYQQRRAQ